ncbi:MAG TPA: DUF3426 domain-containing protein [Methylotenera sp.]|nr:DUF3426 domain-containing protein [Methylotenera sp.]
MSSITNCPACQTQFVVTEEQLLQHNGKVRCGNCLNVFDATQHIVQLNDQVETALETHNSIGDVELNELSSNEASELGKLEPTLASKEAIEDVPKPEILIYNTENEPTPSINDTQPSIFDDLAGKSKLNAKKQTKKLPRWLMLLLVLALLMAAIAQSIYFLRNDIAIYYPNLKPSLVEACKQLGCTIDLPKKIELIVIDDSDIQEDADHIGLIRLSCTIINQAGFNQTYPNLELTLTDVEDKPKLRRIFKPSEYLAANTNIANGLPAGGEVKVKLAIATYGEAVAGYRVLVTY